MNDLDLLEDVVLALIVAWTTAAALYVGWRSGRAVRGAPVGDRDDPPAAEGLESPRDADVMLLVPANHWSRRLAAEDSRCARNGSSAAVVAIRIGKLRESDEQRSGPAVRANAEAAAALARRARASDSICVAKDGTIRTLLVETTEAGARRFVDRISAELSSARDVGGSDVVAAWAAIAPGRDLRAADRLAVARLRGATSGWLRSLAVRRTADVTLDGADVDRGSPDTGGSVG